MNRLWRYFPRLLELLFGAVTAAAAIYGFDILEKTSRAQLRSTEAAEATLVAAQRPVVEVSEGVTLSFARERGFEVSVPVINSGGGFARHVAVVSAGFVPTLDRDVVRGVCPLAQTYALADRLPGETIYAHGKDVIVGGVKLPAAASTDARPITGVVGSVRYVSDVERVWHCATFAARFERPLPREAFVGDAAALSAVAATHLDPVKGPRLAD